MQITYQERIGPDLPGGSGACPKLQGTMSVIASTERAKAAAGLLSNDILI